MKCFFFFFFFQCLDEHSNELSDDGSTTALCIFNFGSRAPNAFVAAFYFSVGGVGAVHSGSMIRKGVWTLQTPSSMCVITNRV